MSTATRERSPIPCELKPEWLTAVCDSREQLPLSLDPLRVETDTLPEGDYSLRGLESVVIVERKSLSDLVSCCGTERERFSKEIQRLIGYASKLLVVEATWAEVQAGQWRSKVSPASVTGSLLSWQSRGLPVLLAGDHESAGRAVARFLFLTARRRWHEARALTTGIDA